MLAGIRNSNYICQNKIRNDMKHTELIIYGSISKDFKVMAQLTNFLDRVKVGQIITRRIDCYSIETLGKGAQIVISDKFKSIGIEEPLNIELFLPSQNYPSHVDEGGISYFIPLEGGLFFIADTIYQVTPFVLYSFEDSKPHNTDFGAIMLK